MRNQSRRNQKTQQKRKTLQKRKKQKKSRKIYGGQYLSNVGYSSGYSLPFYKPYVTNIV